MLLALIAGLCIASLSLGGVFFYRRDSHVKGGAHRLTLPVAVGVFLGIVFFELIPETLDVSRMWGPLTIVCGFLGFYLLSFFLETYHHHHDLPDECGENRKGAYKLLAGDTIHNGADGIVIASAFMVDPTVGILTTLGIALHEIPQEIVEFGVLLEAGYSKKRAALYNFLSATSALVGITVTYLFAQSLHAYTFILTGLAAGNLLYIATADFIPELRKSHNDHFLPSFIGTACGVLLILLLTTLIPAH